MCRLWYTWTMKKIIIPIAFFILLLASLLIMRVLNRYDHSDDSNLTTLVSEPLSNPLCYRYIATPTESEPYAVTETITVTKRTETEFEGSKTGTQSGPDMTNGYQGTLSGTISGTEAVVIFSYIIEGAPGKEQELYNLSEETITKHVYPLLEIGNLLIPDATSGTKTDRVYTKISCE